MAAFYNYHKGIQGDNRLHNSLGSDSEPLLRKLVYNFSSMEKLLMTVVWLYLIHSQLHRLKIPPRLLCPWDFLARILEWVAISFSRVSSWPRDRTHVFCVFCIASRFFTTKPQGSCFEGLDQNEKGKIFQVGKSTWKKTEAKQERSLWGQMKGKV